MDTFIEEWQKSISRIVCAVEQEEEHQQSDTK